MRTKKLFFYIIIGLLFFGCSSNEKVENDVTRIGLTGKVKSLKEFSYEAIDKFGEIIKGKRKRHGLDYDEFIIFNEKGNKIEQNSYNSDGSLDGKEIYKYDEKGNKIENNWYNSDGSLNYKLTNKYDEKGNKIENNWYNSDGSLYRKWTYKYDEKGNLIEQNSYNSDGSLDGKETYKYEFDKQENWIKKIEFKNKIPKFILEREIEYFK